MSRRRPRSVRSATQRSRAPIAAEQAERRKSPRERHRTRSAPVRADTRGRFGCRRAGIAQIARADTAARDRRGSIEAVAAADAGDRRKRLSAVENRVLEHPSRAQRLDVQIQLVQPLADVDREREVSELIERGSRAGKRSQARDNSGRGAAQRQRAERGRDSDIAAVALAEAQFGARA